MAFDARREDYQRMGLRFAQSLDGTDTERATRAFATFGKRFAHEHDSLPQSDSDRAFHLVAQAANLIDQELPFVEDNAVQEVIANGHRILDEALSLDAHCYDAVRMKAAAEGPSFEAYLQFLVERADEVRTFCEEQRSAIAGDKSDERVRLANDLAMRPYLRWLATMSEQALICGHNTQALDCARQALQIDPRDAADVRFTMALTYAKLEQADELAKLEHMWRTTMHDDPLRNAWMLLARISLAFKRCDKEHATHHLQLLIRCYPHAGEVLIRQVELPDGVFARLAVPPRSEYELILAVSESTVLLQEGVDPLGKGVLSSWIANETARLQPEAMLAVMAEERLKDEQGGFR